MEINEAFAAYYLSCEKELDLDRSRLNVNGSGISLGHPLGCSGLRIIVSLIHEMQKTGENLGCASLCAGGGPGMAAILESQ